MSDRDEQLVEELVGMRGQFVLVGMTAFEGLSVLAQVLWATRQPGNVGATAASALRAARKLQDELRLGPELTRVMDVAWCAQEPRASGSAVEGEESSGESSA